MKRIKDGDLKFKLSDIRGITPNFRIRFFTTNSNYYIERTTIDLMWDDEDDETEYLKLNWSELQAIGRGVLNYNLMTYENDDDFDDGIYDHYYQRTTDYFIDTPVIIDDDQPDKTVSELIAEIDQKVDSEITRSTDKDEEHDDAIANLQEQIDNIDIDVDLSDYYTKEEVDAAIASGAADLTGYATEVWVQQQGYLTQHQDISGKANIADLATVATSGSYNDLTNKPTIPTIPTNVSAFTNDAGYLTQHQDISGKADKATTYTKTEVDQAIDEAIAGGGADLTNYYTKTESDAKYAIANNLSTVATSGSYNDLTNKPTIPTIPTNVSAFTNDAGYLTQHQSLSGYATESWVSTNYYNKSYIDTTIGDIETLLSNI